MKNSILITKLTLFIIFLVICLNGCSNTSNKSTSPYFVVLSNEDSAAQFPLKSTKVNVDITGVIADVHVKQTYKNTGNTTIEAVYIFPASTQAAVYKMEMKIGERVIKANIEEKSKARNIYESAKSEGKTASLLEQDRPNVFKMNVANITPGSTVEVSMSYTELMIPTDKIYEFVYPTVVGPRYVSNNENANKTAGYWDANPYLPKNVLSSSTFEINVNLNTSIPIQNIRGTATANKIKYLSKANATVALSETQDFNQDFTLNYQLAGNEIDSGILVYEDPDGENYFVAMVQPQARIKPNNIPAREYVFIVDVSGSMSGYPLDITKQVMKQLLADLGNEDLFNIVFFAGSSYMYSDKSLPVTEANISAALSFIDKKQGSGGTELLCALKAAMTLNKESGYAKSFVILTDGYVTVEKETFDYIRENIGDANFFSFGIGNSVNHYIIEGMAHVGYGESFIALNQEEAVQTANMFVEYIRQPVLTNIEFEFENFNAYDVLPNKVPDLFAERPIVISGKYKGKASGSLKIYGLTGDGDLKQTVNIKTDNAQNQALKYLWTREKIKLLGDYASLGNDHWSTSNNKEAIKKEITELGLKYNLLTDYTSFVAVDTEVSNPNGSSSLIKQPLPLPKNVENSAISTVSSNQPDAGKGTLQIVENYEEEESAEDVIFYIVESMPEFPGGEFALRKFIAENVLYPDNARNMCIEGRVYVQFVVDTAGSVIDVKVVRSVHPLLDAEAVKVVQQLPKWIPGVQRGKKANVSFTIPINFKLEGSVPNKDSVKQNNSSVPKQISPNQNKKTIVYPYQVSPCN